MNRILIASILVLGSLLMACSDSDNNNRQVDQGPPNPFDGFVSALYSGGDNWLCHPALADADNVCASNLDTTRVFADGSTEIEPHMRETEPKVDCFYVYPTGSFDPGINSDLEEGPEEITFTLIQAARYSRFCRVFAPVYRQSTLASIIGGNYDQGVPTAYADVLDSFKQYMGNDNKGRGFILIGHSQGAQHLTRLIAETIEDDEYLLQRLVSAHMIGVPVRRPEGADIGGDFQQVSVCRTSDQTGCVVNYSTYRDSDPELAAGLAYFGTPNNGLTAMCTNPAALAGGDANLNAYFPVDTSLLDLFLVMRVDGGPYADAASAPPITTPFYAMPDFISGQCVLDDNGISYLEATVHADPLDPRADDFNGELAGVTFTGWGLHLLDMYLPLGDLIDLGSAQAEAWLQDQ
jgi:pimeloyl-ACP methyl ester carboxylesterase